VLGICDIWCGYGSVLLTVDPDQDPTPDTIPFFSDFKDAKNVFSYFFLITYPQLHYFQS
jgi:hypothetical protein